MSVIRYLGPIKAYVVRNKFSSQLSIHMLLQMTLESADVSFCQVHRVVYLKYKVLCGIRLQISPTLFKYTL